jgi:YNFM family putative membrane transporter
MSEPSIVRPLAVLSAATFVSMATMRVADPLLPQVAQEFGVSAGDAAIVATAFALAYGICQLFYGVLGDRFGKYPLVALATLASALTVLPAALAGSLGALGLARFASGATAAAIVPSASRSSATTCPIATARPCSRASSPARSSARSAARCSAA